MGVLRALQSLGYEAKSVVYDDRFFDAMRELKPNVAFIALHGPGGEDGHVQALLEYLSIPYTGSGVEASALAIDKHLTKKLLAAEGLPTAAWDLFDLAGGTLPLLPGSLDLPLVIKPRFEGSSAGVVIVKTHEQWTKAMLSASKNYALIFAEEFVDGREFTCGVLGEEALPVLEVVRTATSSTRTPRSTNPAAARTSYPRVSTKIWPRGCRCWRCRRTGFSGCGIIHERISSSAATTGPTFWRLTRCPA